MTFAERIEADNPDLLVTESDAKGLYYCTSANSAGVAIVTTRGRVILNENQCHALAKEIREVCALYQGRGRRQA